MQWELFNVPTFAVNLDMTVFEPGTMRKSLVYLSCHLFDGLAARKAIQRECYPHGYINLVSTPLWSRFVQNLHRKSTQKRLWFSRMENSYRQLVIHLLFILSASLSFCNLSSAQEEKSPVDPEKLFHEIVTPGPDVYANWTGWEEWTPSPDVAEAFPMYRMGYDNDGLVGKSSKLRNHSTMLTQSLH